MDPHVRYLKRLQAVKEGLWLKPMSRCVRMEIPDINPLCQDDLELYDLTRELNKLGGGPFEILYDRSTTTDASRPAFHLYRRVRGFGGCAGDELVLEFSLSRNPEEPWNPDNGRVPGKWLIERFKTLVSQKDVDPVAEAIKHNDAKLDQAARQDAERELHFRKEIDTYVNRGKNGIAKNMGRRLKQSRGQGKSAISYNGQKVAEKLS